MWPSNCIQSQPSPTVSLGCSSNQAPHCPASGCTAQSSHSSSLSRQAGLWAETGGSPLHPIPLLHSKILQHSWLHTSYALCILRPYLRTVSTCFDWVTHTTNQFTEKRGAACIAWGHAVKNLNFFYFKSFSSWCIILVDLDGKGDGEYVHKIKNPTTPFPHKYCSISTTLFPPVLLTFCDPELIQIEDTPSSAFFSV